MIWSRAPRIRLAVMSLFVLGLVAGGRVVAAPPSAPTPAAPADGASVTVPFTISWSQVLDPAALNGGYNWEVSATADFSLVVARDSTFPRVTQDTVSGLVAGTYFWRVNAVNGGLETGPWSPTRSITITGAGAGQLGAPALNPPQGGTTRFHPWESIGFSWSAVAGAATYTTEFSTDARFPVDSANYYRVTNIPGTTDGTLHNDSMPQGTWFMRVRALNADRVAGAPSNVISFSVLYGNPVGPPPALISPTGTPTLPLPVTQQKGPAVLQELVKMQGDDAHHDRQLQALVVVHGDVAKADHLFEPIGQRRVDPTALREQPKHVARALRHTQPLTANQVLAHVQRRLAGTLDVQDGRILAGVVVGKRGRVLRILLSGPRDAALDGGSLVDQHVIAHRPSPVAGYLPAVLPARCPTRSFRSASRPRTMPLVRLCATNAGRW